MSLILQALKKAEAERALGRVPTVHATLSEAGPEITAAPSRRPAAAWRLAIAALPVAAAVAVASWWWTSRTDPPAAIPAAQGAGRPAASTEPANTAANLPAAGSTAATATAAASGWSVPGTAVAGASPTPDDGAARSGTGEASGDTVAAGRAAPTAPPVDAAAATAVDATRPLPARVGTGSMSPRTEPGADRTPAPTREPRSAIGPAASLSPAPMPADAPREPRGARETPPAAVAEALAPRLEELPAAMRQALPPLKVGGWIDAERREDRMVVIDGQVRREGDEIAPGLRLERLDRSGARLSLRGQPFRLSL